MLKTESLKHTSIFIHSTSWLAGQVGRVLFVFFMLSFGVIIIFKQKIDPVFQAEVFRDQCALAIPVFAGVNKLSSF